MVLRAAFPISNKDYLSAAAESETPLLIFLELRPQLIRTNRRDELVDLESNILVPIPKGGGSTASETGHLIDAITAEWSNTYRLLLLSRKRWVFGNENFCLEEEVLSE